MAIRRPIGLVLAALLALAASARAGKYVWDATPKPAVAAALSKRTPGKRILWWNIQYGEQNRRLPARTLDHNLTHLAAGDDAPDVIALGEFEWNALDRGTLATLSAHYPTRKYVPYSETSKHRGVMIFSKEKFAHVSISPLDYVPEGSPAEQAAYRTRWRRGYEEGERYFRRQLIRIGLRGEDGKTIDIVPLHTAQPWDKIEKDHAINFVGKLHAGLAVMFGRRNPLMHQLRRFRAGLGDGLSRTLVFGDLNLVRSVGPITTAPYRVVADGLVDAFGDDATPTYPAASAPAFGSFHLKIDHFLATPDLAFDGAQVLPLQGSDHYPIFISGVQPR